MRFVPNLIPEESRVLKDYFKGNVYGLNKSKQTIYLTWALGLIFIIAGLLFIKHLIITIILNLLGFIIIPLGHQFVENTLHFKLTTRIKSIFCIAIFIMVLPIISNYAEKDKQEILANKLRLEKEQKEKAELRKQKQLQRIEDEKQEQIRKDSFNFYLQNCIDFRKQKKANEALQQLEIAQTFAKLEGERRGIKWEKSKSLVVKSLNLVESGQYQDALPELNNLIEEDVNNPTLFYNRALCYNKLGKVQEAVMDCERAIKLGSSEADLLYNQINPIIKILIGYTTLCCDGTTSKAKSSGACSHHGGVCNWYEPVYQQRRQYE